MTNGHKKCAQEVRVNFLVVGHSVVVSSTIEAFVLSMLLLTFGGKIQNKYSISVCCPQNRLRKKQISILF